jgi:hypothetical protein
VSHAWDRQPGESLVAFAAFRVFRDLGPARTVDAAFDACVRSPRNRRRALGRWHERRRRFHWIERATAWDAWAAALCARVEGLPQLDGLVTRPAASSAG